LPANRIFPDYWIRQHAPGHPLASSPCRRKRLTFSWLLQDVLAGLGATAPRYVTFLNFAIEKPHTGPHISVHRFVLQVVR
jgi:hypothetical protein